MVMKRSALGRGLDALITMDDLKTSGSSSISEIELSIRNSPVLYSSRNPWRNWLRLSVH